MADAPTPREQPPPTPVRELLRQVQGGQRTKLTREDRLRCVDELCAEGARSAEIAELLGICERTVWRYRAELRLRYAEQIDALLPKRLAGELLRQSDLSLAGLRRVLRDPAATPRDKIEAHTRALDALCRTIDTLGSMGLLAAQGASAAPTSEQVCLEAIRLAATVRREGQADPIAAAKVDQLVTLLLAEAAREAG